MIYPVISYLDYLRHCKSRFRIHSPFVFTLIRDVLKDRGNDKYPREIERLRKDLLADQTVFTKTDLGAGAGSGSSYSVTVREIARSSSSSRKKCRLLYRLCRHFQPDLVVELGTALGLGTAYMASAVPDGKIITLEGCHELASLAKRNFLKLGISNISVVHGEFERSLADLLGQHPGPGVIFIDGDHKKEALLKYFQMILPHTGNDSVIVVDDIHWSAGMFEGWSQMVEHPKVTVSIDLFHAGMLFFRKESAKEHFVIRY